MPNEELCSHCQEFGVEGHVSPRLRLYPFRTVETGNLTGDHEGRVKLHQRCVFDWLNLHVDHALASVDAAL